MIQICTVLYIILQLVLGWRLALFFQVVYVVPEIVFPVVDSRDGRSKPHQNLVVLKVIITNGHIPVVV